MAAASTKKLEVIDNKEVKDVEEKLFSDKVMGVFEELIMDGYATVDVVINDKTIFTLKSLDTGEVLDSENVSIATIPGIPRETVERVKSLNILVHSITAINGNTLYSDDEEKNEKIRSLMYKKLIKLQPEILQKLHKEYMKLTAVKDESLEDIGKSMESF